MFRVVTFFIIVAVVAAGAAWLADRPGEIALNWQGYEISMGLMTAIVASVILLGAAVFIWSVFSALVRSPDTIGRHMKGRKRDRGYQAISDGMIAIGAGDTERATRRAVDARKLLPNEPLTKLLDAQAAQMSGRREDAVKVFEGMLEDKNTKLLGLRGLFLEAKRDKNSEATRLYAQEALSVAPKVSWAGNALFEYQCATGDWDGALKTLQIHTENQTVDKAVARRRRAVLLTALALDVEDPEPQKALNLALEAHGLDVTLVPAAVIAGRLSARLGNVRRASKVLEATWRKAPHPDIAEAYAHARPGDSARDRYRRVKNLASRASHNRESQLAMASAALEAQDWGVAREKLEAAARSEASVKVCQMMATLEQGEHNDPTRGRSWIARAATAPRDAMWTADGHVSETWIPVSPITGQLDAFEWKVPVERLNAPAPLEDDDLTDGDLTETPAQEDPKVVDLKPAAPEASAKPPQPAKPVVETAKPADPVKTEPTKTSEMSAGSTDVQTDAKPAEDNKASAATG
ncbi:MAG: heme biosynthesis HemY N-terminal domain-containing protein [Pseudomonadota bacterium]